MRAINRIQSMKFLKKIFIILMLLVPMTVGAIGVNTKITGIKMQPDFWAGIFPSVVSYMYDVTGLEFIEGRETIIGLELETGTLARTFKRIPETGALLSGTPEPERDEDGEIVYEYDENDKRIKPTDAQILAYVSNDYDTLYAGFYLKVSQGFGQSRHGDGDLFNLTAGIKGRWEISLDPIIPIGERSKSLPFYQYEAFWESDKNYTVLPGTPDLSGNRQLLDVAFALEGRFKNLFKGVASAEGANAYFEILYSPRFLNTTYNVGGRSQFFKFLFNSSEGFMIYQKLDDRGENLFSLGLTNAIAFRFLTGKYVPVYAESLNLPLGWYTPENTTFAVEDIIKLEYYGRQFFKYFVPKVSVFLDLSYNWGKLNNNTLDQYLNTFCASAGVHVELTIAGNFAVYYEIGKVFAYTGPDADYFIGFRSSDSLKISLSVEF